MSEQLDKALERRKPKTKLQKEEQKALRSLASARKHLMKIVKPKINKSKVTGLRDGTPNDLEWNGCTLKSNQGWVVNHAGMRITRGKMVTKGPAIEDNDSDFLNHINNTEHE